MAETERRRSLPTLLFEGKLAAGLERLPRAEDRVRYLAGILKRAHVDNRNTRIVYDAFIRQFARPGEALVELHDRLGPKAIRIVQRTSQLSPADLAGYFKEAKRGHAEIAKAFEAAGLGHVIIATSLDKAGFGPEHVAEGLKAAGFSHLKIAHALDALGLGHYEIGEALKDAGFGASGVAEGLKVAGHDFHKIVGYLRHTDYPASEISYALRSAGFNAFDVVDGLHKAKYGAEDIATGLAKAGASHREIAAAMIGTDTDEQDRVKPLFNPAQIAYALKRARFNWAQVSEGLCEAGVEAPVMARILRTAGMEEGFRAAGYDLLSAAANVPRQRIGIKEEPGKPVGFDYRRIHAFLRDAGYSKEECLEGLRKVGFTPAAVASEFFRKGKAGGAEGLTREASRAASVLKDVGFDHLEITKGLAETGFNHAHIAYAFRKLGTRPTLIAKALSSAGYGATPIMDALDAAEFSDKEQAAARLALVRSAEVSRILGRVRESRRGPRRE